jgi:membrane protein DedA with SNARE-associated domain
MSSPAALVAAVAATMTALADAPALSALARAWTYVTLGATAIVTEEAAPLLGGALAEEGHLGVKRVAIAIAIGTQAAHIALYYLGRWRWRWVRARWPKAGRLLTKALVIVRRRPWSAALAVRYAYGLRIALPMACGAARVRLPVFLVGSTISAATWSALFTLVGWMFGRSALALLRSMREYDEFVGLGALALVGVAIFVATRRTQKAAAADESGGTDDAAAPPPPPPQQQG